MPKSKKLKLIKIIAVIGPTASGKSALAIAVAKKFNGEIVSADSRQIYRGMDIGTAKPPISHARRSRAAVKSNAYISQGIPHYLIDIKDPNEDYSAGQYKKDAIKAINKIIKAGKLPILVGGTGLYIAAIVKNLEIPAIKENKKLRLKLQKEIDKKGLDFVFKKLIAIDPEAAYIIDPKNPRRVIRALEIALISGKKFSEQRKAGLPLYNILEIGINPPAKILNKKISKRIGQMINPSAGGGLVNEVRKLARKYGYYCKALDAIGYREIIYYLKSSDFSKFSKNFRKIENPRFTNHASRDVNRENILLEESIAQMNANTIRYAKRQMTWFKKYNSSAHWLIHRLHSGQETKNEAFSLVKKFLG